MNARARDEIEALYRGHRDAVYRFLLRDLRDPDEAEDVTQTAFLQAYRSMLRGGRPSRPRAWLLTIADNIRRRRFVRAQRHLREVPLDDVTLPEAPEPPRVDELRDALAVLPSSQRTAVVLREVAGFSYDEIARELGTTVGSVQMLLFRARRTLRDELDAASRRASAFAPAWLTNVVSNLDRLALPARAAGLAAAAALAVVAVGGSAPAQPNPVPDERVVPAAENPTPTKIELQTPGSGPAAEQPVGRSRAGTTTPEAADAGEPPRPADVEPQRAQPQTGGAAPRSPSLPAAPSLPDPPELPDVLPEAPALPVPLPLPVPVPVPDAGTPSLPALP